MILALFAVLAVLLGVWGYGAYRRLNVGAESASVAEEIAVTVVAMLVGALLYVAVVLAYGYQTVRVSLLKRGTP